MHVLGAGLRDAYASDILYKTQAMQRKWRVDVIWRMALREVGMAGRIRVRHADARHANANRHECEVGRTARHLTY